VQAICKGCRATIEQVQCPFCRMISPELKEHEEKELQSQKNAEYFNMMLENQKVKRIKNGNIGIIITGVIFAIGTIGGILEIFDETNESSLAESIIRTIVMTACSIGLFYWLKVRNTRIKGGNSNEKN